MKTESRIARKALRVGGFKEASLKDKRWIAGCQGDLNGPRTCVRASC